MARSQEIRERAQAIRDEMATHDPDNDADQGYWASLCVSARDGAARLGLTPHTIRSWWKRGQLDLLDIDTEEPSGRQTFIFFCRNSLRWQSRMSSSVTRWLNSPRLTRIIRSSIIYWRSFRQRVAGHSRGVTSGSKA